MNSQEYIDQEIEKRFLQLKEEFEAQLTEVEQRSNAQIIALMKIVQEATLLLSHRVNDTNQLIIDILKEGKKVIESL